MSRIVQINGIVQMDVDLHSAVNRQVGSLGSVTFTVNF